MIARMILLRFGVVAISEAAQAALKLVAANPAVAEPSLAVGLARNVIESTNP